MAGDWQTFEALFPGARRTVLTALFAEPHRWWTLEELAGRAGVRPGSIQTQLIRLRATGIVLEDRKGALPRFQPNPECQIFAELQAIVMKLTSANGGETILVVEDTAVTAQITRILLESWGYRALEAHTPRRSARSVRRSRRQYPVASHRRNDAADDRPSARQRTASPQSLACA